MNEKSSEELQQRLTQMVEQLENDNKSEVPHLSEDTIKCLYSFAYNFYQHGKFKEAVSFFKLLTLLDLKNVKYWMGLGAAQQMLKEYENAIQSYRRVITLNQQEASVYFLIADCYIAQGQPELGLKILDTAEEMFRREEKYASLIPHIATIRSAWKNHI